MASAGVSHPLKEMSSMAAPGSDRALSQQVTQRLAMRGIRSPCRVTVTTSNGEVTLAGELQYAHQRGAATQAAANIPGVRRVVDRMKIKPHVKR
jgi:osmotically-inducible protein OsmY